MKPKRSKRLLHSVEGLDLHIWYNSIVWAYLILSFLFTSILLQFQIHSFVRVFIRSIQLLASACSSLSSQSIRKILRSMLKQPNTKIDWLTKADSTPMLVLKKKWIPFTVSSLDNLKLKPYLTSSFEQKISQQIQQRVLTHFSTQEIGEASYSPRAYTQLRDLHDPMPQGNLGI